MKRIFTFGLMLTAVFALTNCTEELVDQTVPTDEATQETVTPEEEGIPFQVYASLGAETKTVGEKTADGKLKTSWEVNDQITVFYAAVGKNGEEGAITKATGPFTIKSEADVSSGKFSGFLPEGFVTTGTYNWYFVYDASNGNITNDGKDIVVKMGTPSITLAGADNTTHIGAQSYCLMMGSALNLSGVIAPRVQMEHSSALLALRVINQGDAPDDDLTGKTDLDENGQPTEQDITISSLTFSIPKVNTTNAKKEPVTQDPFPIVGNFKTNLTGDSYIPESNNSSSVTISLSTPVTIEPGTYKTFYIPIRPFNEDDINRSSNTGPIFEVSLNGSYRKIEIAAAKANLKAGKVSTLRVPVKLSYPKESNAVDGTPTFVTMVSNTTNPNLIYNGETVSAYIVGTSGANDGKLGGQGKIKISGSTTELLNALDAGFYASTWKGKPAAMTITNLNLLFRGTDNKYTTPFIEHDPVIEAITSELKDELFLIPGDYLKNRAVEAVFKLLGLGSGIPREGGYINLTKFIHPSTITFNGIVSNNVESASDPILILDEEPIFKELGSAAINNLLKEKFTYNGKVPTAQGLKDIVNETEGSSDANDTAEAIYYSLKGVLATNGDINMKVLDLYPIAMNLGNVFDYLIKSYIPTGSEDPIEGLKVLLRDMKFEIEIGSYPYAANKLTAYGTKDAPVVPTEYGCNPIVFWGLSKGLVLK